MKRILVIGLSVSVSVGLLYGAFVEYNKTLSLVDSNQERAIVLLEKLSAAKSVNTEQEIKIYTLSESKRDLKEKLETIRKKNADLTEEIKRLKK